MNKLAYGEMLQLKRWNTPTIFNGWEQITNHDITSGCLNEEEITDFMPQMGPMIGRAVTVVIEPSNPSHKQSNPDATFEYRQYMAGIPGPKIVVVQDADKPRVAGSWWGEVNANIQRSLGCVGTITDGAVRDIDEMTNAGFKAIARRLCVGHAFAYPVRWNCEVEVFGCKVKPGQLIHADKHGFIVVPPEDEARLLEAARFMDANECNTVIPAARNMEGLQKDLFIEAFNGSLERYRTATKEQKFRKGEW